MRVFRVRYRKLGGHYHLRIFSARTRESTFAKLGDLVMDEDDWDAFCARGDVIWEFLQEETHDAGNSSS